MEIMQSIRITSRPPSGIRKGNQLAISDEDLQSNTYKIDNMSTVQDRQ